LSHILSVMVVIHMQRIFYKKANIKRCVKDFANTRSFGKSEEKKASVRGECKVLFPRMPSTSAVSMSQKIMCFCQFYPLGADMVSSF
jgi:hypothetical protein